MFARQTQQVVQPVLQARLVTACLPRETLPQPHQRLAVAVAALMKRAAGLAQPTQPVLQLA